MKKLALLLSLLMLLPLTFGCLTVSAETVSTDYGGTTGLAVFQFVDGGWNYNGTSAPFTQDNGRQSAVQSGYKYSPTIILSEVRKINVVHAMTSEWHGEFETIDNVHIYYTADEFNKESLEDPLTYMTEAVPTSVNKLTLDNGALQLDYYIPDIEARAIILFLECGDEVNVHGGWNVNPDEFFVSYETEGEAAPATEPADTEAPEPVAPVIDFELPTKYMEYLSGSETGCLVYYYRNRSKSWATPKLFYPYTDNQSCVQAGCMYCPVVTYSEPVVINEIKLNTRAEADGSVYENYDTMRFFYSKGPLSIEPDVTLSEDPLASMTEVKVTAYEDPMPGYSELTYVLEYPVEGQVFIMVHTSDVPDVKGGLAFSMTTAIYDPDAGKEPSVETQGETEPPAPAESESPETDAAVTEAATDAVTDAVTGAETQESAAPAGGNNAWIWIVVAAVVVIAVVAVIVIASKKKK